MAGKIDSCMGYDRYTSLLYSNCQGGILSIQRTENAVTVSYRTVHQNFWIHFLYYIITTILAFDDCNVYIFFQCIDISKNDFY